MSMQLTQRTLTGPVRPDSKQSITEVNFQSDRMTDRKTDAKHLLEVFNQEQLGR